MNKPLSLHIKIILSWIVYMPIVGTTWLVAWVDRRLRLPLAFPRDVVQLAERHDWLVAEMKQSAALPATAVVTGCDIQPMNQSIIFRSMRRS